MLDIEESLRFNKDCTNFERCYKDCLPLCKGDCKP